jgi:hypothetical protein
MTGGGSSLVEVQRLLAFPAVKGRTECATFSSAIRSSWPWSS